MSESIKSVTTAATVATAPGKPAQKTGKPHTEESRPVSKTTVTLSQAALAAAAVQKEALETPAQTAQEARGNDRQAQRLLVKQAASKSS